MLKLDNICAGYGRFTVLSGVMMDVVEGDFRVIVGPNGAGKTTLLRTMFGMVKPTQGKIYLDGQDVTGMQPRALLDRGVAYVPQQPSIFPQLSVQDNLEMGLFQVAHPDPRAISDIFGRFELLARRRNTQAQALSGGERRLLELARALMIRPRLLLLDEPSLGLSPVLMDRMLREIEQINKEGVTVVLVEQRIKAAAAIAKSISVLRLGRVVQEGKAVEANDPKWLADAIYGSNEPMRNSA
jgi:ABC-type branched-subunit amino acid transport system ATPase component